MNNLQRRLHNLSLFLQGAISNKSFVISEENDKEY